MAKGAKDRSEQAVADFVARHGLRQTSAVEAEYAAIAALDLAQKGIAAAYADLDDTALADPAIGLLLQLLDRTFEHAEGAVVALVTGCGPAAEVAARAAVEAATTVRYILAGDRAARLGAYFLHYLDGADRQAARWEKETAGLPEAGLTLHAKAIARRREATSALRAIVTALGLPAGAAWPGNVEQRFREIGESLTYRTFYARMSGEVHGDAEETLRFLLGRLQDDPAVFKAMALETVHTTRFYCYFAAAQYLRACLAYADTYGLTAAHGVLTAEVTRIESQLLEIARLTGSGL